MASGIPAWIIEEEKKRGENPKYRIPKYKPAGKKNKVDKENKKTGNHSERFPGFDWPIKRPITIKTTGVADRAIISME